MELETVTAAPVCCKTRAACKTEEYAIWRVGVSISKHYSIEAQRHRSTETQKHRGEVRASAFRDIGTMSETVS